MKKLTLLATTAIIGLAALVLFAVPKVFAADPPSSVSGEALEIAPPVVTLTADPGQTITTQISLRGVSKEKLLVTGEVNDFAAAGEDGTPKILLDAENDEPSPYSLKSWISGLPEMTLEPKQIKNLPITIRVPKNAAPGGYYGVVRFTATPPELKDTGVSLSASLGSLLFIRVNGQAKEGMNVEEFSVNSGGHTGNIFEATPLQFVERLKNTGNTNLQPAGQITITDMFGQKVAVVNVNLPPRFILPDSIRKFDQAFDKTVIGDKMLFGQYTATMHLTYGDSKQTVDSTITFWVVPYKLIGIILVGLIGGFFLLRFLIRRYNRSIIRRSQGGGLRIGSKRR